MTCQWRKFLKSMITCIIFTYNKHEYELIKIRIQVINACYQTAHLLFLISRVFSPSLHFPKSYSSSPFRLPSLSLFRFRHSSFLFFRSISFLQFFFFSLPQFFFFSLTRFRSLPHVFSLTYPPFFTSSIFFLFPWFPSILLSSTASSFLSLLFLLLISLVISIFSRIPPHALSLSLSLYRSISLSLSISLLPLSFNWHFLSLIFSLNSCLSLYPYFYHSVS